jgi:type I restriction enzyme, R subunit
MSRRPAIPAEIRREVAIESGHRCAVCGASGSLEFAHIIPWHRCKRHTPENLICLCANCHQRADSERWGEKTLRFYKENPAIRRYLAAELRDTADEEITLQVKLKVEDFRERDGLIVRFTLADAFKISPEGVQVIAVNGKLKTT